jgi:hypothetical protein
MLAYVFWHWPYRNVDRASYQDDLAKFHMSVATSRPDGFQYSVVFRIEGTPWIGEEVEAYEDWYVVEGSWALDLLNDAAVSHSRKEPHDRVAQRAAGGAGGLYRFRNGQVDVRQSRFAAWLSKPTGTSYETFYASLSPWTSQPGVGLWGRQMVLGPTPELCLLSPARIDLPESFKGLTSGLKPTWPESR